MGVFDDKKFDKLDWMTQITETIDSELNSVLSKLPDCMPIDAEMILSDSSSWQPSLHVSRIISDLLNKLKLKSSLSWEEERYIGSCFKFELMGDVEIKTRLREL